MITVQTALILGAGSSYPYGLPVGSTLKSGVADDLGRQNSPLQRAIQRIFPDVQSEILEGLARELRFSHQPSIDAFLSTNAKQESREVGKAILAASLLQRESPDEVRVDTGSGDKSKWYKYLFQQMGSTEDEFSVSLKNLRVITFNYDRSFEFALWMTLHYSFGMSSEEAQAYLSEFDIIHLYGSLGDLQELGSTTGVPFDPPSNDDQLVERTNRSRERIQILPEKELNSEAFNKSASMLNSADIWCFLGFGYLKLNLDRLLNHTYAANKLLFGTTYKLGKALRQKTRSYFLDFGFPDHNINFGSDLHDNLHLLRENYILR